MTVVPGAKSDSDKADSALSGVRTLQPSGWPKPKGYANGMTADGRIVVTGGVMGWDGGEKVEAELIKEVWQVLRKIKDNLAECGAKSGDLGRLMRDVVYVEEYRG